MSPQILSIQYDMIYYVECMHSTVISCFSSLKEIAFISYAD